MAVFAADTFAGLALNQQLGGTTASDGGTWTARDTTGIKGTGSGTAQSSSSSNRAAFTHSATPPSADYTVSLDITLSSTGKGSLGPAGRMGTSAGANRYWAQWVGGSGWAIYKRVSGTDTLIAGPSNTNVPTTTKTATLGLSGSTITLSVSGASNPLLSVTDTSIAAAGLAGIFNSFSDDFTGTVDNFSAATSGGGTTYPQIESSTARCISRGVRLGIARSIVSILSRLAMMARDLSRLGGVHA